VTLTVLVRSLAVIVIVFASGAVAGYQAGRQPAPQSLPGTIVFPVGAVLSGQNLGFKVVGNAKGVSLGRLVVQADGKWIDVQLVQ